MLANLHILPPRATVCHVFTKKSLDIVPVIVYYHKGTMILRIEKPESCPETAACQTTGDRFMLANLHILPPRATYATFMPRFLQNVVRYSTGYSRLPQGTMILRIEKPYSCPETILWIEKPYRITAQALTGVLGVCLGVLGVCLGVWIYISS